MSILCKLGFHKWNKPTYQTQYSSNIRDYKKTCLRCNKTVRWVEAKKH